MDMGLRTTSEQLLRQNRVVRRPESTEASSVGFDIPWSHRFNNTLNVPSFRLLLTAGQRRNMRTGLHGYCLFETFLRHAEKVIAFMGLSLREYAAWLDERNLLWPAPPQTEPAKATPYLAPLTGIKAVAWNVYGTLLTIADGELLLQHPQAIRMQVAMEKTIHEFNMWASMTRRPGEPWEYFLPKYNAAVEDARLVGCAKGDFPEVNAAHVWQRLLDMLSKKDYAYDESRYGDWDELAEKVAFFFQRCLQGIQGAKSALRVVTDVAAAGVKQGLLAESQPYTLAQLLRGFEEQGRLPPLGDLFTPGCLNLSHELGVRKPSASLFLRTRHQFAQLNVAPEEVLYVSSRLADDLAVAKQHGFRTALFAGDKLSLRASGAECKDPATKPDRLLTKLDQIRGLLGI